MRSLFAAAILVPLGLFAQAPMPPPPPPRAVLAPPPNDPLEPITGEVTQAVTAEQRAALNSLAMHAVNLYQMHAKDTPPHMLQIAFNATASTLFPGGAGQLRETWISGENWRWDASLGEYSLLRISSNGVAYDQQKPAPIPLRLKMVSGAIFFPLQPRAQRESLRAAQLTLKGTPVTCILRGSGMNGPAAPDTAIGRHWDETEYCIDPATGLLMMYSEAPGIYIFYDYANELRFHDRILPGAVTIVENGNTVVQAQLTSITDVAATDLTPYTPTAQMKSQGPAITLMTPIQMVQSMPSADAVAGNPIQAAVVHATFDEQGNTLEIEPLQNSALSAQALDRVKKNPIWAVPNTPGAPPRQREAYIRVEFVPQPQRMPAAGWNFVHQPNN